LSLLVYIAVKYVAYAAWSALGVHLLRVARSRLSTSLLFGFIRLLIGGCFGVAVFLVGGMMHLDPPAHPLLMYFAVYAPIRLLEWSIMAYLIADSSKSVDSVKVCLWILGGIAVSHLADIPMFLLLHGGPGEMLPVGRFLC
jgi:hypothetical protein